MACGLGGGGAHAPPPSSASADERLIALVSGLVGDRAVLLRGHTAAEAEQVLGADLRVAQGAAGGRGGTGTAVALHDHPVRALRADVPEDLLPAEHGGIGVDRIALAQRALERVDRVDVARR